MTRTIKEVFGDRLPADRAQAFIKLASALRFDEALGDWKPYKDVVCDATSQAATLLGIEYHDRDGEQLYEAIGTWGTHPDVPEALRTLARRYPLVILCWPEPRQGIGGRAEPGHSAGRCFDAGDHPLARDAMSSAIQASRRRVLEALIGTESEAQMLVQLHSRQH